MKFKNKVYYGEYTLEHWVELILKKNIVLPSYQRSFVWDQDRVKQLLYSFKNGEFIPPVTIGIYGGENISTQNMIIDGQQRLTSILLAYLQYFPIITKFNQIDEVAINGVDNSDEDLEHKFYEWKFDKILTLGNNLEEIKDALSGNDSYEALHTINDIENFYKNTFLGFTLLVPDKKSGNQQRFYSSAFKSINSLGVRLNTLEVRRSQYFLNPNLYDFFEPNCFKNITIKTPKKYQIDFLRFLYWTWEYYEKNGKTDEIAKGMRYKGARPNVEDFYSGFIDKIIKEYNEALDANFKKIFPQNDYNPKYTLMSSALETLKISTMNFASIIDADIYCFGLIYLYLFEGKEIKDDSIALLKKDIEDEITRLKGTQDYSKDPNAITRVRSRLDKSIKIFNKYAK